MAESADLLSLPVRSVLPVGGGNSGEPLQEWVAAIPAVQQLLRDGLELGPLNVFVGENGAGKSTLVEAIALALGMAGEGSSTSTQHSSRPSQSTLREHIRLRRGIGGSRWGFFLRAESVYGFFTHLERDHSGYDPRFHEMSHGESFLALLNHRFGSQGLYILDEPEAALSFHSSLALVHVLAKIAGRAKSQVIVSTHSPLIAAAPGARIFEFGEFGIRRTEWADLELVQHWSCFLAAPDSYVRHRSTAERRQID